MYVELQSNVETDPGVAILPEDKRATHKDCTRTVALERTCTRAGVQLRALRLTDDSPANLGFCTFACLFLRAFVLY